jgi:phosphohistidine phosphatase
MKLLLIRHAATEDAAPRAHDGDDEGNPLAKQDRWRARGFSKGIRELVPAVDVVVTSPVVRARQTAEILCDVYRRQEPTVLEDLAPDARPAEFARWLRGADAATVAAIGHATHLPALASWLVSGRQEPWIPLKRGGACLIEIDPPAGSGRGRLLWVLTPAILRRL